MIPFSFAAQVELPFVCGRVHAHDVNLYTIATDDGEIRAKVSGTFLYRAQVPADFPTVGDYVSVHISEANATIDRLLPRINLFARRSPDGSYDQQPIAANLDTLFITVALNRDFNLRRMERYAVAAAALGVPAAVLLTKLDLVEDSQIFVDEVQSIMGEIPVLAVSSFDLRGFEALAPFLGNEKTIGFVGSSGVGKSTLVNALLKKDAQRVNDIRASDDRGHHTTTRRSILMLPDGTSLIDTPGMREFALADASSGIDSVFQDVSAIAQDCRFSDCTHELEPGCAVRDKVEDSRLESWRKLKREAAFEARKNDRLAAEAEKNRWKTIHKANRQRNRSRYGES